MTSLRSPFFGLVLAAVLAPTLAGCSPKGSPEESAATAETPAPPAETPPPAAVPAPPMATAEVGKPAPDFTLTDLDGNPVKLSGLAGKTVVLEWFNPDCPFVKYSHGEGPLKTLPAKYTAEGITWLAINSGAPGKQGAGAERNKQARAEYTMGYPVLLDEDGAVGRAYGAKTTPHMYVVDGQGILVYAGALDNAPMGKPEGGAPVNYVEAALADLKGGQPVKTPSTTSYGCGVKYGEA